MRKSHIYLLWLGLLSLAANSLKSVNASELIDQQALTLKQAVNIAQRNDPWLVSNRHQQSAVESMGVASATQADPRVNIGIANIAADNFQFNQEGMTQLKLGVSQMFARGDSLAIKKKQAEIIASEYPLQRQDRQAKVTVLVANLWLEAYKAQQSIALIENDRTLFEQLADVAQANYSSALGKTRQQDIVRAQLELTRLDDRLTQLKQAQEVAQQQLLEWLNSGNSTQLVQQISGQTNLSLAQPLPNIKMINTADNQAITNSNQQQLIQQLSLHPSVKVFDKKIAAKNTDVELAKQKYKPQWGINASYGVRDESPLGVERSDLFSVGFSFDVPLFSTNRQDKQVSSAVSRASSIKTQKWLYLRQFMASLETTRAKLKRLNQRQALYQDRLIPQMHDQAQAALSAYTNDDGDFAEVVRSRIAELNASIDALNIDIERQKSIIQWNYFLMKNSDQIIVEIEKSIVEKDQTNHALGEYK
jgi:hypothetical protein